MVAEGFIDGGRGVKNDAQLVSDPELENRAVDFGQIGECAVDISQ